MQQSANSNAIYNRLQKNKSKLEVWALKNKVEAYRLYDRDIPEYPFLLDRYGEYLLFSDRRESIDFEENKIRRFDEFTQAAQLLFPSMMWATRTRKPQRQGDKSAQYQKLESDETIAFSLHEGTAKFWVNLSDYLDTGLFLDHRYLRASLRKSLAPGTRLLNLFSYTSSVSVHAALAGAQTTSVDLSQTYIEWSQKNFRLNQIDLREHEFVVSGSREFLQTCQKKFDVIFLDPPTFSNSKKTQGDFEVERDHVEFINLCEKALAPQGLLIFSNNKRSFRLDPELQKSWNIRDVSKQTLPFDFRDENLRHVYLFSRMGESPLRLKF